MNGYPTNERKKEVWNETSQKEHEDLEIEVNKLFKTHSIEDIRIQEANTR